MSIQLDDPDASKGSSTNCMACGILLSSIGSQYQHHESDCHTYNLNNKLDGMEPVSAKDIDRVVIEQ
ncbi:hypothetical protein BGW42_001440 [Actinomortierella wolfii]|nr:hypothetical protein BGW42_001440 [Actinomortierella wolfii]